MRFQRSVTVAAALVLAALPVLAGSAIAAGGSAQAAGERVEHDRIVSFWTPLRVQAAFARDAVLDGNSTTIVETTTPGGRNTTGASWPNGTGGIYRAAGKVLFTMGGSQYVCSGTALSNSRAGRDGIVLTAGHCAYDQATRAFATNWIFIPQFDSAPTFTCAKTAFGCWTAKALVVHKGFASAGSFNATAAKYDWAFAVVGGGGKWINSRGDLDAIVGTVAHLASEMTTDTVASAYGYPAAGRYKGKDLTYCEGSIGRDANPGTNGYKLACNMTRGSSGGAWISGADAAGNGGTIQSLNSYAYAGSSFMYGPVFNAANRATSNTIVK